MKVRRRIAHLFATLAVILTAKPTGTSIGAQAHSSAPAIRPPGPGGVLTRASIQVPVNSDPPMAPNWSTAGTLPTGVEQTGGGAVVGSRVYVPGGFIDPDVPSLFDKMQIGNGSTWFLDSEPMPLGPWGDAAVCADSTGQIHVINGTDGQFLYAAHQVYNPAAPQGSRWSQALAPVVRGNFYYSQSSGCAFIGGKIFLFGGYGAIGNGNVMVQNITWQYDPATQTWSDTFKPMHPGRLWAGYTSTSTTAYVAGGTQYLGNGFTPLDSIEKFTPRDGWTALRPLPPGTGRLAPGLGLKDGTANLYLFGGATFSSVTNTFTVKNITLRCAAPCGSTNVWSNIGVQLQMARWFSAWASRGGTSGRLYTAGGDAPGQNWVTPPGTNTTERLP